MGIQHFSGLFVLLCLGVAGALLTLAGEHAFYRLVLPHIRRRQKLRYWLHTSQKIHRALNMTYEDVKKQRANAEKSCNIQKAQPSPPAPPAPPVGGATTTTTTLTTTTTTTKWNNECSKASREPKDNKRVHFNLETLNSRRLQAQATAEVQGGGGSRGTLTLPVCENGGPGLSLPPPAPLPSSAPSSSGPLPQDEELQELQEKIEVMRSQLRAALARRAELQTSLAQERAVRATAITQTPVSRLPAIRSTPTKENGKR